MESTSHGEDMITVAGEVNRKEEMWEMREKGILGIIEIHLLIKIYFLVRNI
jgi:hypothetical protein